MMRVPQRKSDRIKDVIRKNDALLCRSESGRLELIPVGERCVRVRFLQDALSSHPKPYLMPIKQYSDWNYSENEEEIRLCIKDLTVSINRKTSSLSFFRPDAVLLTSEREDIPREMEPFDAYKIEDNGNAAVQEIKTADGRKTVVTSADRVFYGRFYKTRVHWNWQPGEALYGLGQNDTGDLNLRGTTQYLHQGNMKIAVPFLLSSRGYGILLTTGSPAIFNDNSSGSYLYAEAEDCIDYFFIAGTMDEVNYVYQELTGRAALLPAWAYGYIQSQERYESQEEILHVAEEYRKRGIGLDCIVQDWCSWEKGMWGQKKFDSSRYPDPAGMIRKLHDEDVHFMISIWPNMDEKTKDYAQFKKMKLLLPACNIYNSFLEDARRLYWQQLQDGLWKYGIDAWWCDSSEPITPEWNHSMKPEPFRSYEEFNDQAGSSIGADVCNSYGFYHAMTIYEGQRAEEEKKANETNQNLNKRVMNLTRNGYIGQQRFGTVLWSGDISASWETLKKQICEGLNLCASGLPWWTVDAGAFFVKQGAPWYWNGKYEKGWEDKGYCELAVRWFQYAAFLPIYRGHGTDIRREWWLAGGSESIFYKALIETNRLRYRLLPYIYSLAGQVWRTGKPMMRLLAFDFANDPEALKVRDEFMLGPSILVCPVTEPQYFDRNSVPIKNKPKIRRVYLPSGCRWIDPYEKKTYDGGKWIEMMTPLERIPYLVKEGSIVPISDGGKSSREVFDSPLKFEIWPGHDADFDLYEDAGDGYEYEEGEYISVHLHWDNDRKNLSFGKAEGNYRPSQPFEQREIVLVQTD